MKAFINALPGASMAAVRQGFLSIGVEATLAGRGQLARRGYWRAIASRISLSVSVMRSPDRSTVTVCSVPVNRNGDW